MKNINRFKFLRIAVTIGLLAGIIFSLELWLPVARTFPRAPLVFALPDDIVFPVERLLAVFLLLSLVLTAFSVHPKTFSLVVVLSIILMILFDQLRLQPWVYQYLLLLIIFALTTENKVNQDQTLCLSQIMIAGLYFWSGVQKLNFTFSRETLPMLLTPLQNIFPSLTPPMVFTGISIALLESLIGCGLLFRKTRNSSVLLAAAMHAVILSILIAKNYNSIVWVWNIFLIAAVVILFWKNDASIKQAIASKIEKTWRTWSAELLTLASVFLPILSFAGLWDMYLSGALYSGNTSIAVIRLDEPAYEKLPPKAKKNVFQIKSGEKILPLIEWSISELNVPVPPAQRVFKQAAKEVCKITNGQSQVELIIKERPSLLDGSYVLTRTTCKELEND